MADQDALFSLALSMQRQKGVYALLLGSGISRAAGIPTGWDIVLDLIRRRAGMLGEEPGARPDEWYQARFGKAPGYSALLGEIAQTEAERQGILRAYFEPNAKERESGLKLPTKAHRAVARLVSGGYVRVILTTNLDRLLEVALADVGVESYVVSSAEQIHGMVPVVHQKCLVVKLHGDYQDTRIRNTQDELAAYPRRLDRLLDRLLDEFGLVICGWSANWDEALRKAVERCPNRRYTTYWTTLGKPSEAARGLVERRRARVIGITEADGFFPQLADRVEAFELGQMASPDSVAAVAALTSRYLAKPEHGIALEDLLRRLVDDAISALDRMAERCETAQQTGVGEVLAAVEATFAMLAVAFVKGGAHAAGGEVHVWSETLSRIGALPLERQFYPTFAHAFLLLTYAAGVMGLHRQNWDVVAEVLGRPQMVARETRKPAPWLQEFNFQLYSRGYGPGSEGTSEPSDRLFRALRLIAVSYFPSPEAFMVAFDRFEFILGLQWAHWARRDPFHSIPHRLVLGQLQCLPPEFFDLIGTGHAGEASAELANRGILGGSPRAFRDYLTSFLEKLEWWPKPNISRPGITPVSSRRVAS